MTYQALTVRQPFASRIVRGEKRIENRTRDLRVRGLILIHAGAQMHDGIRTREHPEPRPWLPSALTLPRSAIVGAVQVVGSHNAETCGDRCIAAGGIRADDAERNDMRAVHHWELAQPVEFDPSDAVPAKGALGLWEVTTPSIEHLVTRALMAARRV